MDPENNEDWLATALIYAESVIEYGKLEITVNLSNVVMVRQVSRDKDPTGAVEYAALSDLEDEIPLKVLASFEYSNSNEAEFILSSIRLDISCMPPCFPDSVREPWLDWLSKQCMTILQDQDLSFPVCDFIQHRSIDFFPVMERDEALGVTVVWYSDWRGKGTLVSNLFQPKPIHYFSRNNGSKHPSGIQKFTFLSIQQHWKDYAEFTCPICFTEEKIRDAFRLNSCQCLFCKDCVGLFISVKVSELNIHHENPFVCPCCRVDLRVLEEPCASLLSEEQSQAIRTWQKERNHPKCHVLPVCPRSKCRLRNMHFASSEQDPTLVFCDDCGSTWCALCLTKYTSDGASSTEHKCRQRRVLLFCRRYLDASDDQRQECDMKWHWIKDYSQARLDYEEQYAVDQYIESGNAQRCPTCKAAIERSEGCFHMNCTNCGTHFCYECGDKIYPPYYGTHRCWEDEDDDFGLGFFEMF